MKEAAIDLKKYPWYDKHARAIRTVARFSGLDIEQVLRGLNAAIVEENVSLPDAAFKKKAA